MQMLAFKVLFRRKGTASAIISIALLVALVTAVNCLVNGINAQSAILSKLADTGGTYIVVSKNSTCLSDSQIDPSTAQQIRNNSNVQYVASQRIIPAAIATNSQNFVTVRGVDDLNVFYQIHPATLNGSICQTGEADIGIILAKQTCISKNGQLNLTIGNITAPFTVAGVVQGVEQTDAQVIIPLSTLNDIVSSDSVSFIEFSLKDQAQAAQTLSNITDALPPDTKIVSTQQVTAFAQDVNNQTVTFISVWSVAIYVVVAAASYIIASRVVNEAEYELGMFRALGTKKTAGFNLIFVYALTVGFVGSVVGVSVGIAGAQFASTFVRWIWGSNLLTPFLELNQANGILLLSLGASLIGCIYPAIQGSRGVSEASLP